MIFVPYAIPVVIGALMWGFLYSPRFGPLAEIFGLFGLTAPDFLSAEPRSSPAWSTSSPGSGPATT